MGIKNLTTTITPKPKCEHCQGTGIVKVKVKGQTQERTCLFCKGTGKSNQIIEK